MRRNVWYLVVSVVLIVGTFVATLAAGNTPILGLDLQGGFSVVLSPVGKFKSDSIDVARDIIETRVNGLGVAEPEISRQGNDIVVDLPGVKDRAKAERLVGKTAELRFRPVLANLPPATKKSHDHHHHAERHHHAGRDHCAPHHHDHRAGRRLRGSRRDCLV